MRIWSIAAGVQNDHIRRSVCVCVCVCVGGGIHSLISVLKPKHNSCLLIVGDGCGFKAPVMVEHSRYLG